MKTKNLIRSLLTITCIFALWQMNAQVPPVGGCSCNTMCGPAPTGGYSFINSLPTGCPVDIRYTLFDNMGNACAGGLATVPAPGGTCILPCSDFSSCTGPWNIVVTLININGSAVTGPNTIDHVSTPSLTNQPSPDPCTLQFNLATNGCSAKVF